MYNNNCNTTKLDSKTKLIIKSWLWNKGLANPQPALNNIFTFAKEILNYLVSLFKGKDQYWKCPNFKKWKWKLLLPIMWKNMFWILPDDNIFDGKPPTNWYIG